AADEDAERRAEGEDRERGEDDAPFRTAPGRAECAICHERASERKAGRQRPKEDRGREGEVALPRGQGRGADQLPDLLAPLATTEEAADGDGEDDARLSQGGDGVGDLRPDGDAGREAIAE